MVTYRVAFIVDLESPVVHQPRPGPFHDPPPGEDHERMRVDPVDDLNREVTGPAVARERGLEPAIAPQLRQPRRFGLGPVSDGDPTGVVRHVRGDDHDGEEQTETVNDPERLASGDLLPSVIHPW